MPLPYQLPRLFALFGLGWILLGTLVPAVAGAADEVRRYAVTAGAAEPALKQFSDQSGRQVIAPTQLLAGVRTQLVQGDFTAREALERMFADTGLAVRFDEKTGAFAIVRSAPATPAKKKAGAADGAPPPTGASASSDTMNPKRPRTLPALLALALGTSAAAQTAPATGAAPPNDAIVRLNPFEVAGTATHGYRATNSISGTAMNTPLRDVPMNISVVTDEFLKDMLVGNLNRALDFTSSVTQANRQPFSNRGSIFSLRGFRVRNTLIDGVPAGDYVPPSFIDRIEVVKGPNTIYGQTDPGGIINIISKRPVENEFAELTAKAGTDGLWEFDADVNTGLLDNALKLRVIGNYRQWDGWRWTDGSEQTSYGVAGTYRLGRDTEFTFHASDSDLTGVSSSTSTYSFEVIPTDLNGDGRIDNTNVGGVVESGARYNSSFLPREYTAATPADRFRQTSRYLQGGLRHTFSPALRAQYSFVNAKQSFVGTFREFNTFDATGFAPAFYQLTDRDNISDVHTLNLLFDFETGPLKHRLMGGGRLGKDRTTNPDGTFRLRSDNAAERAVLQSMINSGRRIRLQLTKNEILAGARIWTDDLPTGEEIRALGSRASNNAESREETQTYYLTDSVSFLEGRARALAGVRQVRIKSLAYTLAGALAGRVSDQRDTSYQVGGIYDLTREISGFVNVATAFNPNVLDTTTGNFFPGEESESVEFGFKFENLWNGHIAGSVSAFEITKQNVVRRDFNPITFRQDAEITDDQSRGVEVDIFFNFERWNSILSYTHLDAKVVNSRSTAAGLLLEGATPDRLSFWTSFDLGAFVKGLRIGGGVVWADGPIQQFGTSASRLILEDGYTEVSAFVRYETKLWRRKTEFGLNVSNLNDVFYLRARAAVNDPRMIVASMKIRL